MKTALLRQQKLWQTIEEIKNNPPSTLEKAVERGGLAISALAQDGHEKEVSSFIKERLIKSMTYLGAYDVSTVPQLKMLVGRIQSKSYALTLQEIDYFFTSFEDGEYGKLYAGRTVNPQDVMTALVKYQDDVMAERGVLEMKRRLEDEAKENLRIKQNAISYEEYLRMKGKTITNGEPDLLQKLKDSINKNK